MIGDVILITILYKSIVAGLMSTIAECIDHTP